MTNQIILYQFSRKAVEAGDFSDFLSKFSPGALPKGKRLADMMDSLIVCVEGYDHDAREVYAIPEVRAFYQKLSAAFPYWLYFSNLKAESLMTLVLCLLPSLQSLALKGQSLVGVHVDPAEIINFLRKGFPAMNGLCEKAGLSERKIYERTKAIFEYFSLPFG